LGLQALDKIFDSNEIMEALTEEEKRLMQAYLKEQQEGGEKWKKKAGSHMPRQGRVTATTQDFGAGIITSNRCRPTYRSSIV
jgi:hypothetical protein